MIEVTRALFSVTRPEDVTIRYGGRVHHNLPLLDIELRKPLVDA